MSEPIEDFLEVDNSLPGQNYVCLSFVSPEDILNKKELYFINKFLTTFGKNYGLTEQECEDKYKDFMYLNQEKLEKEFYEKNNFQTTIRGLKVRGVYDTLKEAQVRAQVLQRKDPHFNVFIGQVGYWLPWDPNPHKVDKQEYAEKELNTLVQKYRENQDMKDEHFRENLEYAKEQASKKEKEAVESSPSKSTETQVNTPDASVDTLTSQLESADPWLSRQQTQPTTESESKTESS
jgi:hypothetical protein